MFFSKKKTELLQKEQALARKEKELEEKESHLNQLVKERLADLILDISHRDYLTSTRVFQDIRTTPDLSRLCSSMTQDIKILSLFNITAKVKGESRQSYDTSLEECSCDDYKNRKSPCKHMYRLAVEVGALLSKDCIDLESSLQKKIEEFIEKEADAKKATARTKQQLKKAQQKESDVQKIMNESTMKFPWLSTLYADYEKIMDEALENELRSNPYPAPKAADKVRQIRERKEALRLQCQAYKYRLALYHSVYPELNTVKKLSPQEAYKHLTSNKK